jgi:hypothetical protein
MVPAFPHSGKCHAAGIDGIFTAAHIGQRSLYWVRHNSPVMPHEVSQKLLDTRMNIGQQNKRIS